MYWLITLKDGKQKTIKADNGIMLGEKLVLENVLSIVKLSDDIFVDLSEQ